MADYFSMQIIKNSILLLKFVTKVRAVNRENGSYHRYVNKIAHQDITKSNQINDGSISQLHFLKIQWYMATNLYLGELLSELRHQKLNIKEKKSLIYLGALMAITDLMVDDHQIDSQRISILLNSDYHKFNECTAIEKIFILYHEKLLSIIDSKKAFLIKDFSLRKPQIDSQSQLKEDLTAAEIHELTRNKGGTAILLTASLLFEITEKNKAAFYQLGAFIQYMNDNLDMCKDMNAGVTTFVSFCTNYDQVNEQLKLEFDKTTTLFQETEYDSDDLYRLMFYIHAMYVAVVYKNFELAKIAGSKIENLSRPQLSNYQLRIKAFTSSSLRFCIPKILCFENPGV